MGRTSDLYEKLAKELGISKVLVEVVVNYQFRFLKKEMPSPELPSILLHGLGTFRPRRGRVEFLIKKLIAKYRKETNVEKQLELKEKIGYLWEVRKTTYK